MLLQSVQELRLVRLAKAKLARAVPIKSCVRTRNPTKAFQ